MMCICVLILLGGSNATIAGLNGDLHVFPTSINLSVGETSLQPLIPIVHYNDGRIIDETFASGISVTVANHSVAEAFQISFMEGEDTLNYWYVRGLNIGTTVATLHIDGQYQDVAVQVNTVAQPVQPLNKTPISIGTNLTDLSNLSSELVFSNVFMTSQPWISSGLDDWGGFPDPDFNNDRIDSLGWVNNLLPGQVADTMMLFELDGHYPKGSYTLTWQGEGTLLLQDGFSDTILQRINHPSIGPTHVAEIILAASNNDGIRLRIMTTAPSDPITNIQLWMPEAGVNPATATTVPRHPFRLDFISQMSNYHRIRFGLWQLVMDGTDNQSVNWSDATPVDYATQFMPWGASPEWDIRLINIINQSIKDNGCQAKTDPWIQIPYRANDDYVRRLAEMIASDIDFVANPDIKIYIEWANEVWNPSFEHLNYAASACNNVNPALDCSGDIFNRAFSYQVHRSLEIFTIFEEVFNITHPIPGGDNHLVKVLGGVAGFQYANGQLLSKPGAATGIDALAIAPYFGATVGIEVNQLPIGSLPSIDALMDRLDNPSDSNNLSISDLQQRIREMAQAKAIIDVWNTSTGSTIELVAYESGQHLVGDGFNTRADVVPLYAQANAHPRMGDMYRRLFLGWNQIGGTDINHFVHKEKWWWQGFFGALSWYDEGETTINRPKYQVILEALAGDDLFCDGFEN